MNYTNHAKRFDEVKHHVLITIFAK